jgi:hypothetical protein
MSRRRVGDMRLTSLSDPQGRTVRRGAGSADVGAARPVVNDRPPRGRASNLTAVLYRARRRTEGHSDIDPRQLVR